MPRNKPHRRRLRSCRAINRIAGGVMMPSCKRTARRVLFDVRCDKTARRVLFDVRCDKTARRVLFDVRCDKTARRVLFDVRCDKTARRVLFDVRCDKTARRVLFDVRCDKTAPICAKRIYSAIRPNRAPPGGGIRAIRVSLFSSRGVKKCRSKC